MCSGTEPRYPIETQKEIIMAYTILHNYLMGVDSNENLIYQVDWELMEQGQDDEELAPILSVDEEYGQGEMFKTTNYQ